MKVKFLFPALMAALLAGGFVSCSDDDDDDGGKKGQEVTSGIYVINNGNMSSSIAGSLTTYNVNGETTQNAFQKANNSSLGDIPQCAIQADGNLYIGVYQSNVVWVCDPYTMLAKKCINFTGNEASNPRTFVEKNGKVYVAMYTGYVVEIDTKSNEVTRTVKVGPNPEGMAIVGNKLYVANSDGMNYQGGNADCYISVVNLGNFTEESRIQDTSKVLNPTAMCTNGNQAFVLCMGNYADVPATIKRINSDNTVTDICPATMMAIRGNELYAINAPYGASEFTYKVYNTASGSELRDMVSQKVDYPAGIVVDSATGDICILSYTLSAAGYAQYREPCYANVYTSDGTFRYKFDCGVGATSALFIHK